MERSSWGIGAIETAIVLTVSEIVVTALDNSEEPVVDNGEESNDNGHDTESQSAGDFLVMVSLKRLLISENILKHISFSSGKGRTPTAAKVAGGEKGAKQAINRAMKMIREPMKKRAHIMTMGMTKRGFFFLIPTKRRMVQSISKTRTAI